MRLAAKDLRRTSAPLQRLATAPDREGYAGHGGWLDQRSIMFVRTGRYQRALQVGLTRLSGDRASATNVPDQTDRVRLDASPVANLSTTAVLGDYGQGPDR